MSHLQWIDDFHKEHLHHASEEDYNHLFYSNPIDQNQVEYEFREAWNQKRKVIDPPSQNDQDELD